MPAETDVHDDSLPAKRLDALAVHGRIRIRHRDDDPPQPGLDNPVDAWPGSAAVAARLERAVERCTLRGGPCLGQRANLRVIATRPFVVADPHDAAAAVDDDRTHHRIGARVPAAQFRESQGLAHVHIVVRGR